LSVVCIYNNSPNLRTYSFKYDKISKNVADFSLSDGEIVQNQLGNPVKVRVRGNQADIWSREFKSLDPSLAKLNIHVPLQKRTTLAVPPKDAVPATPKKLRGRVLTFNQECVLKDVLVLVQVKTKAGAPWLVVGAATTDASGNFSMPYPYGKYTQAQAVVSLAPKESAEILIVPGNDNETLSDDFLYLLLTNPECASPTNTEDCDCKSIDKPNRLPDHSDLIGSDVYSQDIGGTCVNLSKPNRTISEFNYQAIVRVTDPSVANYTLTKIETGLDAVDVAVVAALSSGAAQLYSFLNSVLTQARAAPESNAFFQYYLQALEGAWTHVVATKEALTQSGSLITASVLATTLNHIDAAIAILSSYKTRTETEDIPSFPPESIQFLNFASSLKDQVSLAIDTLGNAARYELTGGANTYDRQSVSLNNPVAWQDTPETQPSAVQTMGAPFFLINAKLGSKINAGRLFGTVGTKATAPSANFSQAVTIATGHILHYKAELKADGYSLGDLLYSLPLAPGQKKEIVVFDASHTLIGTESQSLAQNERLAMGLINERDITSQLAGNISESLRGSSVANTKGISAGFGTGGQGYGGTGAYGGSGSAVIGVAGGAATSDSFAAQDSTRGVSQFFGEKLRQSIMQNAEGYRQLNASVVTTVQEGQRYGVTSEVVANHNHCHALTMMYFEVLRHYAVIQKISTVEECVFVPLLLTRFTTENIARWRDVLAPSLLPLPSETYLQPFEKISTDIRQHPLLKAFDADQRIKTHYANVDFPSGSYDAERIQFIRGTMRLRIDIPRPRTRFDRILSFPIIKQIDLNAVAQDATKFAKDSATYAAKAALTGGFLTLFEPPPTPPTNPAQYEVLAKEAIFDAYMTLDANYQVVPPAQCMRIKNFKLEPIATGLLEAIAQVLSWRPNLTTTDFFAENNEDKNQWQAYSKLLGYNDVETMLNAYFRGNLIAEWDGIFYNDIAPRIFEKILGLITLSEFKLDFASDTKYKGGERVLEIGLAGTTSKQRNQLKEFLTLEVSDPTLRSLQDSVTLFVEDLTITYSTSHYNGTLYSGTVRNDLLDRTGVELFIPENNEEKRNPKREDRYLATKLIDHLNSHLEYYNRVLWYNLDPERRFMLLDGFSIQIYDKDGKPITAANGGMRSLASVLKNEVIAVVGNSLVMPVAPGYRVNGAFVQEKRKDSDKPVTLFDHYEPLTPFEPYRISVPTKGVFAEAVQGACNACEKIETERLQDWNRFPNTDEPTSISPIVTPTPTVTDWRAAFKDFATPIVNIQNAPATPDPGAGWLDCPICWARAACLRTLPALMPINRMSFGRIYQTKRMRRRLPKWPRKWLCSSTILKTAARSWIRLPPRRIPVTFLSRRPGSLQRITCSNRLMGEQLRKRRWRETSNQMRHPSPRQQLMP
jgi:hypothetical protein